MTGRVAESAKAWGHREISPHRGALAQYNAQHWVYAQRHAKAVLGVGGNADGVCGGTRQVIFNVAAAL